MNKKVILTQEKFDTLVEKSIANNTVREYVDISFDSNIGKLLSSVSTMFDDGEDEFSAIYDNDNNILSLNSLYKSRESIKQELPLGQKYILNAEFNIEQSISNFFLIVLGTLLLGLVNTCVYLYSLITARNELSVYPLIILNKKSVGV